MTAASRRAKAKPTEAARAYSIRGTDQKFRGKPPPPLPGSLPHLGRGQQAGRSRGRTIGKGRPVIEAEIDESMRRRAPVQKIKR